MERLGEGVCVCVCGGGEWAKWLNILAIVTHAKTNQDSKEKDANTCSVRYENTTQSKSHQTKWLQGHWNTHFIST